MPLEQILELVRELLVNATYIPALAALVVLLTAVSKRFVPLDAQWQAILWQVLVWGLFQFARQLGYEELFVKGADILKLLLEFILTFLPAVYGSVFVSAKLYAFFRARRVPLLGYSRS